jgi:predicted membrane channel-forming protein YqfA (hemolysin III family)
MMFDYRDLFQWERFITPAIVKVFYWLAVGISVLFGLSGILSGFALMALHPLGGLLWVIGSLIGIVIGVIFARMISEFALIIFRINEHLGAIRQRGQM